MSIQHLHFGFESTLGAPSGVKRYSRMVGKAMGASTPTGWEFHVHEIPSFIRPLFSETWSRSIDTPFSAKGSGNIANVHSTSLFAPVNTSLKHVVTIHDLVPITHPETLNRHGVNWHLRMLSLALEKAAAFVVPSVATFQSLSTYLSDNNLNKKITIAGGAPSLPPPNFTNALELEEKRYVVFLGTLEPRKRVDALIEAVSRLEDFSLVVLGNPGWGGVNPANLARLYGLPSNRFHYLRNSTDQQVSNIVSKARALVLPSQSEGFGLPLVEAMALGTPVIHSDSQALVEVAGGSGITVQMSLKSELFVDGICQAIEEAEKNRSNYASMGLNQSAKYSWGNTAKVIWETHQGL
jgi:glycosyltransferase involved in cell wall biosynthesis